MQVLHAPINFGQHSQGKGESNTPPSEFNLMMGENGVPKSENGLISATDQKLLVTEYTLLTTSLEAIGESLQQSALVSQNASFGAQAANPIEIGQDGINQVAPLNSTNALLSVDYWSGNSEFAPFSLFAKNGFGVVNTVSDNTSSESSQITFSSRLLPVGALGSGYLSYLSYSLSGLGSSTDSRFVTPENRELQSVNRQTIAQPGLTKSRNVERSQLQMQIAAFQLNNSATSVEARRNENILSSASGNVMEFAKRFFLLTNAQDSKTLWYRDYGMSDNGRTQLQQRLIESEFLNHNNINRVFLNGALMWQRIEEHKS